MSSRLDLGPADLDRLEDALEDLELDERFEAGNEGSFDDDPVAQRLVEYRALLQLSREAMPLEDVPAGLLDGVLAQARQAAAAGAATAAPAPSFWSRWRLSLWVPTLAFAGSAALLLLVLVPKPSADSPAVARADADMAKDEAQSVAPSATAEPSAAAEPRLALAQPADESEPELDEASRGAGLVIGERAPDLVAQDPASSGYGAAEPSKRRKATSGSSGSAGAPPALGGGKKVPPSPRPSAPGNATKDEPKPTPEPEPIGEEKKSKPNDDSVDLWPEITRADADRRGGGGCGLAKMRYENLRKASDSRVRARALAGLGLCEAAAGSMGTAKKLFAQARAADPGVSSFIDTELARIEGARDPSVQSAD